VRFLLLFAIAAIAIMPAPAHGQFKTDKQTASLKGAQLGPPSTQRIRIGVIVKAVGGPCQGIYATVPIPADWPEQQIRVAEEDISPLIGSRTEREIGDTVRQMVVEIPSLPAGQVAKCLVTYEVSRNAILAPETTDMYTIPKKLERGLMLYLGPSPYIETKHAKIMALAKELPANKEHDWQKVEAIYEFVREHVKYVNGPLKGAVRALADKTGDCEELSSLFIAICRAAKIPARTVWVQGHCYPEFYLLDDDGKGHWFPCQAAGSRAFGGIDEKRPILQKGDNFKDPDRPREKLRFMSEFLKGSGGGGKPEVTFVREIVGG
jgi:hypothetical protein